MRHSTLVEYAEYLTKSTHIKVVQQIVIFKWNAVKLGKQDYG